MFPPRTVLLPDGESELALRVLRCLSEYPDISVRVLSRDRWPPIRFSRHLSGFSSHNVDDFDLTRLGRIIEEAKSVGADIILPVEIPSFKLLGDHRDVVTKVAALPPLSQSSLFDAVSDKWRLAQLLGQQCIPHPKTIYVEPNESAAERLLDLHFPILAKPRRASGGHGIQRFESHDQAVRWLSDNPSVHNVLFQEFINGDLISCNILSKDGEVLAHTIQRALVPAGSPFKPPAGIEFVDEQMVLSVIEKLLRGLGWSGVANFDLIYNREQNEVTVLEMNPRYWRSLLGSLVAGVNFPALSCLVSEGRTFPRPTYQHVRYIKPEASLRPLINSYLGMSSPISSLHETGLPFILRDPLPECAIMLSGSAKTGSTP